MPSLEQPLILDGWVVLPDISGTVALMENAPFVDELPTMWGPLVISWFISPNNYSYKL